MDFRLSAPASTLSPFVGQIYGYVLTDATKHKETIVRTQALSTKSVFFLYLCFLVFRCIGECVSQDLLYFVNLTSSCLLIPRFVGVNGAAVLMQCRLHS